MYTHTHIHILHPSLSSRWWEWLPEALAFNVGNDCETVWWPTGEPLYELTCSKFSPCGTREVRNPILTAGRLEESSRKWARCESSAAWAYPELEAPSGLVTLEEVKPLLPATPGFAWYLPGHHPEDLLRSHREVQVLGKVILVPS